MKTMKLKCPVCNTKFEKKGAKKYCNPKCSKKKRDYDYYREYTNRYKDKYYEHVNKNNCQNDEDLIKSNNIVNNREYVVNDFIPNYKNEKWKYVDDNKRYIVSNRGRVFNVQLQRLNKLSKCGRGYMYCSIYGHPVIVHRLVAEAFINRPSWEQNTINHKNGDKENNKISNLEWHTLSENMRHSAALGLRKTKPLKVIDKNGVTTEYYSQCYAAECLGLNQGYIRYYFNNGRTCPKGFTFLPK